MIEEKGRYKKKNKKENNNEEEQEVIFPNAVGSEYVKTDTL
jgi:hypothetical protein